MADKIKELEKENQELKAKLETFKEKATKINDDLNNDNQLLKDEIKELKKKPQNSGGKSKKEDSADARTPKEKGYTTIDDIKKFADQKAKNAPKQKQPKK